MKEKYYCIKGENDKYKLSDELNKLIIFIKTLEGKYTKLKPLVDNFMKYLNIKEKYHDKYCYFIYTNDNKYVIMFIRNTYNSNELIQIHFKNLISDKYSAIISFRDSGGYYNPIYIDTKTIFTVDTQDNLTGRNIIVDINTHKGIYTVNNVFNKFIRDNIRPLKSFYK